MIWIYWNTKRINKIKGIFRIYWCKQNSQILSSTHPGIAAGGIRSCRWKKWLGPCLLIHCKIAYFDSVTIEQQLFVSLGNFVTMRKPLLIISCKIFSWIRMAKLKMHAVEFCDSIKDFVSLTVFYLTTCPRRIKSCFGHVKNPIINFIIQELCVLLVRIFSKWAFGRVPWKV